MSDKGKASVLIFGAASAVTHARVRELKSELEKRGVTVVVVSDAAQLQQAIRNSTSTVEWAVWAGLSQPQAPTLKPWIEALGSTLASVHFAALVATDLNAAHKRELKSPVVVRTQDSIADLVESITSQSNVPAAPAPNRNPTVSSTKVGSDPLEDMILSMEDHSANAPQKIELPLAGPDESLEFQVQPLADDIVLLDSATEAQSVEASADDFQVSQDIAVSEMIKQDEGAFGGPQNISDNSAATVFGALNQELPSSDDEQATQLGVSPLAKITPSPPPFRGAHSTSLAQSENKRAPVAGPADVSINHDDIKFHNDGSLSEVETLKRYAALKERESREHQATVEVLQKQNLQTKERLAKSENERRRVSQETDELRLKLKSLEDVRDQHAHQSSRAEAAHGEQLKSLQLRLDSAQFQAHKAEKKLDEFRERVRSDILKIRLKERELSNKLELQKRDAEALLSAKDERLLAQKREIDRLEFEIETLKERMVDDTRRAEERASKLTRALKSLRMAQGVLSGIEEEVLPGTGNNDSDGEAA